MISNTEQELYEGEHGQSEVKVNVGLAIKDWLCVAKGDVPLPKFRIS